MNFDIPQWRRDRDFYAAIEADREFQDNLIRQFGDPCHWKRDYRYEIKARELWDSDTLAAHRKKMAADERIWKRNG